MNEPRLYTPFALSVIDGDTLDCILPTDPFPGMFVQKHLRLYGIDTPEKNTQAGQIVMSFVKQWIEESPKSLRINYITKDKFDGRFVGQIFREVIDKTSRILIHESLVVHLLDKKMAKPFTGRDAKTPWTKEELDWIVLQFGNQAFDTSHPLEEWVVTR